MCVLRSVLRPTAWHSLAQPAQTPPSHLAPCPVGHTVCTLRQGVPCTTLTNSKCLFTTCPGPLPQTGSPCIASRRQHPRTVGSPPLWGRCAGMLWWGCCLGASFYCLWLSPTPPIFLSTPAAVKTAHPNPQGFARSGPSLHDQVTQPAADHPTHSICPGTAAFSCRCAGQIVFPAYSRQSAPMRAPALLKALRSLGASSVAGAGSQKVGTGENDLLAGDTLPHSNGPVAGPLLGMGWALSCCGAPWETPDGGIGASRLLNTCPLPCCYPARHAGKCLCSCHPVCVHSSSLSSTGEIYHTCSILAGRRGWNSSRPHRCVAASTAQPTNSTQPLQRTRM